MTIAWWWIGIIGVGGGARHERLPVLWLVSRNIGGARGVGGKKLIRCCVGGSMSRIQDGKNTPKVVGDMGGVGDVGGGLSGGVFGGGKCFRARIFVVICLYR